MRLEWTLRLVGLGLLSGILLSWKLWHTDRFYPLFPVWGGLPQLPRPLDLVFLVLFCLLIGWLIVRPDRRVATGVLACMILLALQDQSRWQPWFSLSITAISPTSRGNIFGAMESKKWEDGNPHEANRSVVVQSLWLDSRNPR